jgi:excisionase family DNA binding protein
MNAGGGWGGVFSKGDLSRVLIAEDIAANLGAIISNNSFKLRLLRLFEMVLVGGSAMTTVTLDPQEPIAPTDADALVARESARRLAPALTEANGTMQIRVGETDGTSEPVTIPTAAFRLLVTILAEMARGNAVRLIPHHAELTTQEAADLLNVSRPYVVRLLDEGRIPSHRVGTHRRVLFKDVMHYKEEHRRVRGAALDRLSALDQELGLT